VLRTTWLSTNSGHIERHPQRDRAGHCRTDLDDMRLSGSRDRHACHRGLFGEYAAPLQSLEPYDGVKVFASTSPGDWVA